MFIIQSLLLVTFMTSMYAAVITTNYVSQVSPTFSNLPKPTGVVTSYPEGPYDTSSVLDTTKFEFRWTDSGCVKPKVNYFPTDIYTCPKDGYWGLTYDDEPFNLLYNPNAASQNPYAEPALNNFLMNTNEQKATLFLCVHTWFHQPMTTLANAEIVSELYWCLKAIKAATGVTSKCWCPPQGDVDERACAIAWQMDTHGYFQTWVNNYVTGKDRAGYIVLDHEIDRAMVIMTMFWLPKLQQIFNIVPAMACNGVNKPCWEETFTYSLTQSHIISATTTAATTTSTASAAHYTSTCVVGSSGEKKKMVMAIMTTIA
ncbi:MAG: hypothetical protein EXX96DRAFT_599887 [Benjaminiella poitrasii]|nr:MAG: hypothetical protein EXX96DRAFT_599887 [Benjaminiella poitrasii]